MSTQNKNRLYKHKNVVDNKMDEINNSISTFDKNMNKTDYKNKISINKGITNQITTTIENSQAAAQNEDSTSNCKTPLVINNIYKANLKKLFVSYPPAG